MLSDSTGLPKGNTSLRLNVIGASATAPMRIQYSDRTDHILFEQFLILANTTPIVLGEEKKLLTGSHIQVLSDSGYLATLATLRDPSIPG